MVRNLTLDIADITVEGATPDEGQRLRAVIERALAQVARQLSGTEGAIRDIRLGDLRLDLADAQTLLAPGGEAELARRIGDAIRAAWERGQ
ncbi:hypothetical protein [Paracoccus sp. KR1-242]|uniref:hypothetical protein n=1 Tax=Paracoccus sp. KR1-242 TaxID=3410028 RepID=UPI003C085B77